MSESMSSRVGWILRGSLREDQAPDRDSDQRRRALPEPHRHLLEGDPSGSGHVNREARSRALVGQRLGHRSALGQQLGQLIRLGGPLLRQVRVLSTMSALWNFMVHFFNQKK